MAGGGKLGNVCKAKRLSEVFAKFDGLFGVVVGWGDDVVCDLENGGVGKLYKPDPLHGQLLQKHLLLLLEESR